MVYIVTVDRNVLDFLYLKLVAEPILAFRTNLLKYQLLARLRYDRFLLNRNRIPRRFMDMAKEISPDSPDSDPD